MIDTSQSSQLDEISNQISGLLESIEEEEEAGSPPGESSYFQTDDHNYNRLNQSSPPDATTTRTDSEQGVPLVADMVIDPMDTSSEEED